VEKRLVRLKKDRVFLGVLGGLAQYFEVDPTLVRLIFVVLLVFNPVTMALLYFLAALVIPEEGEEGEKSVEERLNGIVKEAEKVVSEDGERELITIIAIVLILAGLLYLAVFALPALFVFKTPVGTEVLAILLILVGVILLFRGE
jgi:phage shock protein C